MRSSLRCEAFCFSTHLAMDRNLRALVSQGYLPRYIPSEGHRSVGRREVQADPEVWPSGGPAHRLLTLRKVISQTGLKRFFGKRAHTMRCLRRLLGSAIERGLPLEAVIIFCSVKFVRVISQIVKEGELESARSLLRTCTVQFVVIARTWNRELRSSFQTPCNVGNIFDES